MQQAIDFLSEVEAIAALLAERPEADFIRPTRFKGWTANDILVHLHIWNRAADAALFDPPWFEALMQEVMPVLPRNGLRPVENAWVPERGFALLTLWLDFARDMAARWMAVDPRMRVPWVGPDMSARSALTARQMEHWAHAQALFDLFGVARVEDDRLRNIVVLGVNTFEWSHRVQGLPVPAQMPHLRLTAPSGAIWEFGQADQPDQISGAAVEFAQVVTQTRNIDDTSLVVRGEFARRWMENAQCFAGPRERPPAKGVRGMG